MSEKSQLALATEILDILPNPVLVKNQDLEYVWINSAFEKLFSVSRTDVIGRLDAELFPDRQVSQCNGGDLRVLSSGDVDEAVETVFDDDGNPLETITRKSRLSVSDDEIYLVGVMHDITDVTRANEALQISQEQLQQKSVELAHLANTDELTGCQNRRALDDCEKNRLLDKSSSAAVLLMDLDNFKKLNDRAGHDCGDAVLKHFADLVRNHIKAGDNFVRMGGEEFAVFTSGVDQKASIKLAEDIREQLNTAAFLYNGKVHDLSVSIGVTFKAEGQQQSMLECLRIADTNLYKAKEGGRNRVEYAA